MAKPAFYAGLPGVMPILTLDPLQYKGFAFARSA